MELTTALLLILALMIFAGVLAYWLKESLDKLDKTLEAVGEMARPAAVSGAEKENLSALRLQACERLTLMLERIAVPNLLLRQPPAAGITAKEYTASLLLGIREEFEYNVTQQIYVSDALWSVVNQARDNVSQLIVRAAEGAESAPQIVDRLRLMSSRQPQDAIALAQQAVRQEATRVLGK
ncbi:hypothetical protein [Lewinella sp. W8]|uniref:DUF7935 family protein n=1 Tax=Lewinella sp. W8 TaxID=2528208 RepID=UPI0010676A94|nr:hypothetical protein [Lewinella sp. W8]MTB50603.1 hypothetical protein [Lewinella sp. W8]